MGGRTVSPGGALLRSSRMFSMPKPLPEPHAGLQHISDRSSKSMTKSQPQMQSVATPLSSRQNGDWGFKRSFPLKTTLNTSTPLIRLKNIDAMENVTDFESAADHTLSLEKFQELRIAMSIPKKRVEIGSTLQETPGHKSVFEERFDVIDGDHADHLRWKYEGPWLARMTEGEFMRFLDKQVRPQRAEFRALLRKGLAEDITARQNSYAMEKGIDAPPAVSAADITEAQFTEYLRALRNDRAVLYAIVSKFLDLAPLGQPVGVVQSLFPTLAESPWGKAGPPTTHPSAGISYLRTGSVLENHPVYGPQARRTPTLARLISPRSINTPPRLGVAGFVSDPPPGDNEFNIRHIKGRASSRYGPNGIANLDTTTFGGAKTYVEPVTASVDPSGRILLELTEAGAEAQVISKESNGKSTVYHDGTMKRELRPQETDLDPETQRLQTVTNEILQEKRFN
ncbi:mitochondrial ribosomal protein subunit domain-containing protein [Cordyceps javanica]|uniref:Mitochondrial ribosomal protein subunit domain-containing protein n=1 Tax=Cordyceps javanica TaxID=43265 RepID=A0A545UT75_9HYPO|nr:mitochondrial ribosomal protein subunit domain-containing protein [Cordyceps javanica]TQW03378.1 mitochondrial ribosomal protein subunit domain-containing protein [Cordyceps javanica]